MEPLGLADLDEEEKEVRAFPASHFGHGDHEVPADSILKLFATSVNTPIKPPTSNKDGTQQSNGHTGRKVSISGTSGATPGAFGLPSPSVARGAPRRRETSESYPFPQNNVSSPGGFNRDEGRAPSPPPSLLRRRTDLNKNEDKDGEDRGGSLKRNPTGPLTAGFNAPSSPWGAGPQSAGLSPMGSFGNYGLGSAAGQPGTPGEKRPGIGSGRAESRFKNVLSKDGADDASSKTIERKPSISSLTRVNENESWRPQEPANEALDEADEGLPTGSAALASDADVSPPHPRQGYRGFGTPNRQGTQDEFGFGAFGMTSDNSHGFHSGYLPGRDNFQQTPAAQRSGLQSSGGNEPMSPTDTNPYQSPEQHGVDRMGDEHESDNNAHLPGLGQFVGDPSHQLGGLGGLGALPNLGRNPVQAAASDRSQTSSVGPTRGFSGLGGLSGLGSGTGAGAWPVSQGGMGTPSRQTAGLPNPFGSGIFSNQMSDIQSPGLAGLGGNSTSSAFGGSRMASIFPPQMQDQMHQQSNERAPPPFGSLGDFGRGAESPFGKPGFNDGLAGKAPHDGHMQQQESSHLASQAQAPGSSASNQPPAPQQRTMVMPDRMRWIYKDPQGQTQGPWSGLEMHDWYKAGFFSPELLVKKYEDPDYEPLAQLIRRIGNSREPFLVPQIGIPHGAQGATGPNAWAGSIGSPGSAQPPFASSFPSFGTTLTAEQQNALERRKQEEQYLMARQKEHLAQAQIASRMQMPPNGHSGMPSASGQLQHHSSAHSLQSQPSFGSISSPAGAAAYQPSPIQGPTTAGPNSHPQGFFDNSFRAPQAGALGAIGAPPLGHIREEEIPGIMDRLNIGGQQSSGQFGAPGQPIARQQQAQDDSEAHEAKVQQMMQDRARLQQEQDEHDARQQVQEQQQQGQASEGRFQQFQRLQGQAQQAPHDQHAARPHENDGRGGSQQTSQHSHPLSLTEQVQKAASAKHSPDPQQPGLPQPFPPAPSESPLPAPAAQRTGRASVADQLQTETRDASQTPSVDTPSATIAPWAKEPAEAQKGPSLREIQEAEARKAAEQEAIAIAQRRAQLQKEMEAQAHVTIAPPGIPATSTWGAPSPATPTGSSPAVWTKTAQRPAGTTSSKTLAQIQKEEEARKRRQASAAAAALQTQASIMGAAPAPMVGKSYANLASKVTPAPAPGPAGAWTTVGASGKTKTPAPAPPAVASRSVSTSVLPTPLPTAARKVAPSRSTTLGTGGAVNAQDEFKKWAVGELRPDLKKNVVGKSSLCPDICRQDANKSPAETFVQGLLQIPNDAEIIMEAVHYSSDTIDSRHFAEEWIRRKRLADKGLVDTSAPKSSSPAANGGSGWSEVAKKPSKEQPKEETANGNFRVVAAKKRGSKK